MANALKELIFKPKWLHKDAAIRARAVKLSQDPRLLELLPEFARNDPDAGVRLRAAQRITEAALLKQLAYDDDDEQVRDYAGRVFTAMMIGEHPHAPTATERSALLEGLEDSELVERLAISANDATIRGAAQQQISKQGMLGDIAINDDDPQLRQQAADRITQRSTLERVARDTRKNDKKVFRIVTSKLERDQIASGDLKVLQARALELCEAAEALSREPNTPLDDRLTRLNEMRQAFDALDADTVQALKPRFLGACRILESAASSQAGDPLEQKRAHARGAIESYLAAIAPLIQTESTQEIGLVQAQISHAEKHLKEHDEHLDDGQREALKEALAALESNRQRLLQAQPADANLSRICNRAEKARLRELSVATLERMHQDWDKAWSGLSHLNPSDHSLRNRFESVHQRLMTQVQEREQRVSQALGELDALMTELETHLEDGDLARSARLKQKLLDSLKIIGRHPTVDDPEFKARVAAARGRLHELRDWQHWANNEVRARLCKHAEEIPGSGMHPDAVARKVKELQKRWKELDQSEHLPGDPANRLPNPGMFRRFRAACNQAFELAKPFFEKRSEVRQQHRDELIAICEELEAAVSSDADLDIKTMERLVGKGRRSLRELSTIAPKDRGKVSRRLREGANAIDAQLSDHYQIVERRKQRIIDEVTALAEEPDLDKAINAAKEAQRTWQQAGHTRRGTEQKMWKAFRKASDAIFNRLDQQRAGERAQKKADQAHLREIINEVRGLARLKGAELMDAPSQLPRIRSQWRQSAGRDRRLEQDFEAACDNLQNSADKASRDAVLAERRQHRSLHRLCRQVEQAALTGSGSGEMPDWQAEWDRKAGDIEPGPVLADRFSSAQQALQSETAASALDSAASQMLEQALDLCIRAEFLAGVESPEAHQQQRMDYQVKRLSARLGGGESLSPANEARELEEAWIACGPLPADQSEALETRFIEALEHFEEHQS